VSATAERLPDRKTRRRPLLKRAVELRLRGLSYDDIATKLGVAKSTVHEQLSGVFDLLDPERVNAYREHRVTLLDALELKMLGALSDDERIAKASLNNAAFTFTQVFNARRLESGQSTANLALHELVERVERDHGRRRLATTGSVPTPPAASTETQPAEIVDISG
jgi:hypothetical protein